MNREKLKQAEAAFFDTYPHGFEHPELVAIGKKHKMPQMIALSQEVFGEEAFSKVRETADNMVKVVSRSSMVSLFEKPKFRDTVKMLSDPEREMLVLGLQQFLHGDQPSGFEDMVRVLHDHKLAKWSLMTIIPNYVFPLREMFVKPTTAKGVIKHFELEGLQYKPTPSWDFYQRYRDAIEAMKAEVDPSLAPSNAAFGGFLMMSLPDDLKPRRPKPPEKEAN